MVTATHQTTTKVVRMMAVTAESLHVLMALTAVTAMVDVTVIVLIQMAMMMHALSLHVKRQPVATI